MATALVLETCSLSGWVGLRKLQGRGLQPCLEALAVRVGQSGLGRIAVGLLSFFLSRSILVVTLESGEFPVVTSRELLSVKNHREPLSPLQPAQCSPQRRKEWVLS